jgi:membrane protein
MSFTQLKQSVRGTVRDVLNKHTIVISAGLAYYFVLSLFPLLIVLASIAVYLPVPNLFDQVLGSMARIVPPDAMGLVRRVLSDVLTHSHPRLLSVGILGTLWAAAGGFSSTIEALNVAYDVPETRSWWRTKLLALELTFIIGALFIVALGVLVVGPEFGGWLAAKLHLAPAFAFAWNYVRWGVAISFTVLGVELLYFLAPNVRNRFWSTLPGAALAVGLWIAASWALGIYIQHFASFNKTYGTLGAAVVLLTWFYWSNIVILVGAEFNSELIKSGAKPPLPLEGPPPERSQTLPPAVPIEQKRAA